MRRKEARINKYCLNKSNQVSVEEAQYKKSNVKNVISKNINEKGLKQHQKIKHNSSQYEKVGNNFKCGTCEKAEFF